MVKERRAKPKAFEPILKKINLDVHELDFIEEVSSKDEESDWNLDHSLNDLEAAIKWY